VDEKTGEVMKQPKRQRVFKLEPQGLLDTTDARVMAHAGKEVQKTSGGPGTPPNGTMGMCYVQTLEGEFIGLVLESSLVPTNRTAEVVDRAAEARESRR
jgi:hypothetical protein